MNTATWDDSFATGNVMVDDQHKTLFSVFHEIETVAAARGDLAPMLARLDQYVAFHFSMEESLMQARGYPGLSDHKRIHDDLTLRAKRLFDDHRRNRLTQPAEAARSLANWLVDHIQQADMAFVTWLRNQQR
jgi:hemerythrin-like metal-binding protein